MNFIIINFYQDLKGYSDTDILTIAKMYNLDAPVDHLRWMIANIHYTRNASKLNLLSPTNQSINIVIVGAGWAGISVAYLLSHFKNYNITLIESEDKLGGQASSTFMKHCYVDYSWRVYFDSYKCTTKILSDSGLLDKLCPISPTIITDNKESLAVTNIFKDRNLFQVLRYYNVDLFTCLKFFFLLLLPRVILEKFYSNVSFMDYLNNYDIFKLISGPVLGFDPKKVCVPTVINLLRRRATNVSIGFENHQVTCGPPDVELFSYLEQFLRSRGVNVLLSTNCTELIEDAHGKIVQVKTDARGSINCDEVVLSCSLYSVINLVKKFNNLSLNKKLYELTSCLQSYLSMNLYFSEKLGPDNDYVILKQPWQPIIETKRNNSWYSYIKNHCNPQINDVWNVAVMDYYKGHNGKILRECSLQEAVDETINQMKLDTHISQLESESGKKFHELLIGVEIHPFWKEKDNKIFTTNPKFSVNTNAKENLLDYNYPALAHNIWFGAYYCKRSFRYGASMENSSHIGLMCGKLICERYNLTVPKEIDDILEQN